MAGTRRTFLASCAASLMMPWPARAAHHSQVDAVGWEGGVDAYLAGDLRTAARVLEIPMQAVHATALDAFDRWLKQATRSSGAFREHDMRTSVRRLQGSAALVIEILLPLSVAGVFDESLRSLEKIAADALARVEGLEKRATPDATARARMAHFRARWHLAFLQVLINVRRFRDAEAVDRRIRLPATDHLSTADHEFLRGLLLESKARSTSAELRAEAAVALHPQSRRMGMLDKYVGVIRRFERAIELDPAHHEARLRLGRIELERARYAQAIALLTPLATGTAAADVRGLALLFLADALVASGSESAGGEAYERAAVIPATRQSALAALTQLALRRGDLSEALDRSASFDVSDDAVGAAENGPDAWSIYLQCRRSDSSAVLGAMRKVILS